MKKTNKKQNLDSVMRKPAWTTRWGGMRSGSAAAQSAWIGWRGQWLLERSLLTARRLIYNLFEIILKDEGQGCVFLPLSSRHCDCFLDSTIMFGQWISITMVRNCNMVCWNVTRTNRALPGNRLATCWQNEGEAPQNEKRPPTSISRHILLPDKRETSAPQTKNCQ